MYILTSVHDTELKMLSNLYPHTDKNHFLYCRLEAVSNHQFIASGFVLNISKHITLTLLSQILIQIIQFLYQITSNTSPLQSSDG